jgi:GR25 family glycosyltransferase involved in LPS biosynthesis
MTDDVHVPRLRRTTRFPFLIAFVLAFMIGCEYFFSISHTVQATFRDATEGKSLDRVDHDDESIRWRHSFNFMPKLLNTGMNDTWPRQRRLITESFVISFDNERASKFVERNHHSDIDPVLWVPAVDGFSQKVLTSWAQLSGNWPPINASLFGPKDKGKYQSPHAVGCYMAHWHLIRHLGHRDQELRPDLYFVFEDDASCIPNLKNRTLEVMGLLPYDWDMLYIGGKPITYFKGPVRRFNDSTKDSLRRDICRGAFGLGSTPLAPDGTRNLTEDQPYWKNRYMTNTHSYVINPRRIENVLRVLEPKRNVPIDILLAEHMSRDLNVYMTTRVFCHSDFNKKLNETYAWRGYYGFSFRNLSDVHPALESHYLWQTQLALGNCSY